MDISKFRQFGKSIICVGRNYRYKTAHSKLVIGEVIRSLKQWALAAEQGKPIPESPIVFLKPVSSYIEEGQQIKFPPLCEQLYHEVELGVVIGKRTSCTTESDVMDHVAGYALCLDMTAWDMQQAAKVSGHPWSLSKGFDTACPVSGFIGEEKIPDTSKVRLWMKLNGVMKQDSSTSDMIFTVPKVLAYISQYMTMEPGDLVLTGSPAGAGPVSHGDKIEAGLEYSGSDLTTIKFDVL